MNDDFITNIKEKIAAKNEKVQEVLSLCDNVLLYSERVVIPKKLQNRILRDFHTEHPGINRMKSLMRSYVYWPKMVNDITDTIEKCKGCVLAAKAHPLLLNLGQKQNNFGRGYMEDFYYLIVVDSYSKWPEVLKCRRPTTGTTTGFLHELFARFGVVDCVVSDNGSQFTSAEFKEFFEIFQNKAYHHTAISPTIKRPSWTFCRYVKSTQKSIWFSDEQGTTAISAGIQTHTQSQYTITSFTSRDYVCQKDKIRLQ